MFKREMKMKIDIIRNQIVGKITDPKTQINHITIALLYKFLSYQDTQSKKSKAKGKITYFTEELEGYNWNTLMSSEKDAREQLEFYKKALDGIKKSNNIPELFKQAFKNFELGYDSPIVLRNFLKEIHNFNYNETDDLGNAFEYLLSILGSQGAMGQFRTPRHIIDFMVEFVSPKHNESILDPACGTSGFLISAYKHILRAHSSNYTEKEAEDLSFRNAPEDNAMSVQVMNGKFKGEKLNLHQKKKLQKNTVGYDIDPNMVKIGNINLFLHGFAQPQMHIYDTLSQNKRWGDNFNVILANPPFMSPKGIGSISPTDKLLALTNSGRAEVLFVGYIMEHLERNGRAGIIVPEGVIFKNEKSYQKLREKLVKDNLLLAVVSLPAKVFEPYSGVKTSILFLDKERSKQTDEILFIDVKNDGFELGTNRKKIDKNDLPEAFEVLKAWKEGEKKTSDIAFWTKKKKIGKDGSWNLIGNVYRSKKKIISKYKMVELGDVLEYEQPTKYIVKSSQYKDEYKIPVLTAGKSFLLGYTNETEGIFSTHNLPVIIFDDFTTANKFVDFQFKVKSSAMKILKPQKNIELKYIFHIMNQINFDATTHKRYWISQYSKIKIPLPSFEIQKEIVIELDSYQKIIDGAKQIVINYRPTIKIEEDGSWNFTGNLYKSHKKTISKYDMVDLKNYAELRRGTSITKKSIIEGNIPVIAGGKNPAYFHNKANRKAGAITLSSSGANAGFVNFYSVPIFASDCFTVISNNDKLHQKFLFFLLRSQQEHIYQLQSGSGQPHVYPRDLQTFKIPLPSFEIQKEIVTEIEEEQALVNSTKKLIKINEQKIKNKINKIWNQK